MFLSREDLLILNKFRSKFCGYLDFGPAKGVVKARSIGSNSEIPKVVEDGFFYYYFDEKLFQNQYKRYYER